MIYGFGAFVGTVIAFALGFSFLGVLIAGFLGSFIIPMAIGAVQGFVKGWKTYE